MFKKIIILLCFALLLWSNIYAQETQPKVKLEKIYTFDQNAKGNPLPEIIKALKSKAKGAPQEDVDWVLNSVRLDIANKDKVLYTNDGKEIKLPLDTRQIVSSKNLKYIAIYAYNQSEYERDAKVGKINKEIFYADARRQYYTMIVADSNEYYDSLVYWQDRINELYSERAKVSNINKHSILIRIEDGKMLWDREDVQRIDYISDDGKVLVAAPGVGHYNHIIKTVYFYNQNGILIKTISGLRGIPGLSDLSADGAMFSLYTEFNDKRFIAAYNNKGEQLWLRELNSGQPSNINCGFSISSNHEFILFSGRDDTTLLINKKGDIIDKYDIYSYHPRFSVDGRFFISNVRYDTVYVCNIDKQKVTKICVNDLRFWSYSIITAEGKYILVYIRDNGEKVKEGLLLDNKGDVLEHLPNSCKLSPHGFILKTDNNIYMLGGEK